MQQLSSEHRGRSFAQNPALRMTGPISGTRVTQQYQAICKNAVGMPFDETLTSDFPPFRQSVIIALPL